MKTLTGSLALTAAVLIAGSTLAQTAPRGPAPRPGTAPPPAVGTVPPGQPAGETRGTGVGGGTPDAPPSIETGQLLDKGPRWPNTPGPSSSGPVWRDPNIISVAPGQPDGPPSIETGQIRIKEPPVRPPAAGSTAPGTPAPAPVAPR